MVLSNISVAQSKKEILLELKSFISSKVINIAYDKPKKEVYEAMRSVLLSEYPVLSRESFEKGYVEGTMDNDKLREKLGFEIISESQPYRINMQFQEEVRKIDINGKYSNWENIGSIPDRYALKVSLKLYNIIYGNLQLSEELMTKIEAYNATQKKDKHKILAGRDY